MNPRAGRPAIVESSFVVPTELTTPHLRLEPLRPLHNESDFEAWTSSVDHIRTTPGFEPPSRWPSTEIDIAQNRLDLVRHFEDFEARRGFTFTVLDKANTSTVVGCVYIYPDSKQPELIKVSSWVRASHAELDTELYEAVDAWIATAWPFEQVSYRPWREAHDG